MDIETDIKIDLQTDGEANTETDKALRETYRQRDRKTGIDTAIKTNMERCGVETGRHYQMEGPGTQMRSRLVLLYTVCLIVTSYCTQGSKHINNHLHRTHR